MHWYVDNDADDFKTYMTLSELIEERLSGYEGLIRGMCLERGIDIQLISLLTSGTYGTASKWIRVGMTV